MSAGVYRCEEHPLVERYSAMIARVVELGEILRDRYAAGIPVVVARGRSWELDRVEPPTASAEAIASWLLFCRGLARETAYRRVDPSRWSSARTDIHEDVRRTMDEIRTRPR